MVTLKGERTTHIFRFSHFEFRISPFAFPSSPFQQESQSDPDDHDSHAID